VFQKDPTSRAATTCENADGGRRGDNSENSREISGESRVGLHGEEMVRRWGGDGGFGGVGAPGFFQ
jgi:hypothetical protein